VKKKKRRKEETGSWFPGTYERGCKVKEGEERFRRKGRAVLSENSKEEGEGEKGEALLSLIEKKTREGGHPRRCLPVPPGGGEGRFRQCPRRKEKEKSQWTFPTNPIIYRGEDRKITVIIRGRKENW